MSQGPSTLGIITTSSLCPISVTSVVRSSNAQGDSRLLTRVHSAVSPRSISLPILTSPSRAGSLRSTDTASSRLPSRMSDLSARSGSLAAIFSLLGSKKWIIRDGLNGISRIGAGAPIARGFPKSRGFRTVRSPNRLRPNASGSGGQVASAHGPASRRASQVSIETRSRLPWAPRREPWLNDMLSGTLETTQESEYARNRNRSGGARGQRRASVWPLPRGVRGRRRLQALAGQDGDGVRRSPVLLDHDEA